jgi:hypothetical protein
LRPRLTRLITFISGTRKRISQARLCWHKYCRLLYLSVQEKDLPRIPQQQPKSELVSARYDKRTSIRFGAEGAVCGEWVDGVYARCFHVLMIWPSGIINCLVMYPMNPQFHRGVQPLCQEPDREPNTCAAAVPSKQQQQAMHAAVRARETH